MQLRYRIVASAVALAIGLVVLIVFGAAIAGMTLGVLALLLGVVNGVVRHRQPSR